MSLYSLKKSGGGTVQPWSQVITLAEAGKGCDGLFGLYDSLGDKTLTGANTIATQLDGPERVVRYGALTLGDGATATSLSAANRCRGLTILCDSLIVKANATLNMTGKGPRIMNSNDIALPAVDLRIPSQIILSSDRMALALALSLIGVHGLVPWDVSVWQPTYSTLLGFQMSISQAGTLALAVTGNGGAGAAYSQAMNAGPAQVNGYTGGAGSFGCCGGGGGGAAWAGNGYDARGSKGRPGCILCGGGGGGGCVNYNHEFWYEVPVVDPTSKAYPCGLYGASIAGSNSGGGAGSPPGSGANGGGAGSEGVGGRLMIICRGQVNILAGGKVEANGMQGGSGSAGGGGSGGGVVTIITPTAGNLTNSGTIQAAGGAGGGNAVGGAGGAGSVVTKTFAQMGW